MQSSHPDAAGEEIGSASPKLSGTAAGEDETQARTGIDHHLYLVQEVGQTLDFVDHHDPVVRLEPLADRFGTRGEFAEGVGFKQVVMNCGRECRAGKSGFSRLPGAKQK